MLLYAIKTLERYPNHAFVHHRFKTTAACGIEPQYMNMSGSFNFQRKSRPEKIEEEITAKLKKSAHVNKSRMAQTARM